MRRRPSPSLVVSIIAVVFAAAGTSIAAVNFARNAGAVDGKSATGASSSNARAAGKLVATGSSGKIPARFLDLAGVVGGGKSTFAQGIEVADNSTSNPASIGGVFGLGGVAVSCGDENAKAGTENPRLTVNFANGSNDAVNVARSIGNGPPVISSVPANTSLPFTMTNSNTFRLYIQGGSSHYTLDGVFRQVGQGTATGSCQVFGVGVVL